MGQALELVVASATAAVALPNFSAAAAVAGNSLTIRNADLAKAIKLLTAWADVQSAGALRIRSPKMHDNVQGLRLDTTPSDTAPLLPEGIGQRYYPQDVLTVELAEAAVAGDIGYVSQLIWYEDLPGNSARLIGPDELMRRMVHQVSVENTIATGVGGGFTGEEALNAEFALLKANTDYALVGYLVDTECAAVRWRGADTSNLGVGGPGNETLRHVTSAWFLRLSKMFGIPLIPVLNSANVGGILVDACQDENGADVTVTTLLVELVPAASR